MVKVYSKGSIPFSSTQFCSGTFEPCVALHAGAGTHLLFPPCLYSPPCFLERDRTYLSSTWHSHLVHEKAGSTRQGSCLLCVSVPAASKRAGGLSKPLCQIGLKYVPRWCFKGGRRAGKADASLEMQVALGLCARRGRLCSFRRDARGSEAPDRVGLVLAPCILTTTASEVGR